MGKHKPTRFLFVGLVVAIALAAGIPLIQPRKTLASGTAPTVDQVATTTSGVTDTLSVGISPGASANFILLGASYRNLDGGFTDAIGTADFDGNAMTFLCRQTGDGYSTELWYYNGASTGGSFNVNAYWNAAVDDIVLGAISFDGVATGNPVGGSACDYSSGGWSNTPSVTLSTTNNYSILIGIATTYSGGNTLSLQTDTQQWYVGSANVYSLAGSKTSSGGSDTFNWLGDVNWPWSTAAVQINGTNAGAVRGTSGDLWADVLLGKRDFTEISPGLVDAAHTYAPGGVAVYKNSGSDGYAYIWDSQNSRILGMDLGTCYGDGANNCAADLVIGQPNLTDYSGCNHDSSFSQYPDRGPAAADSLCGVPEWTHTVLEDKSFTQMYVDQGSGDLYVFDTLNNRVLRYDNPLSNDTTADAVWGQPDFTGNKCNHNSGYYGVAAGAPTDDSLCFLSNSGAGGGVAFDASGNMWVADGGNNRVLRFPNSCSGICQAADIVIGQPDFTTGGDNSAGNGADELQAPTSIVFSDTGAMYVADTGNNRLQIFEEPFSTGMGASGSFSGTWAGNIAAVDENTHLGTDLYITSNDGYSRVVNWYDTGTNYIATGTFGNPGAGSIGFDANDNLLVTTYVYGQNVTRVTYDGFTGFNNYLDLFAGGTSAVDPTGARFGSPGWAGVTTIGSKLYVGEGHIWYWNDKDTITNGQAPDGYIGDTNSGYTQLKHDNAGNLYAISYVYHQVEVFFGPVVDSQFTDWVIGPTINLLGGGSITLGNSVSGIAPTPDGNYLWISDTDNNRVVRVKDPTSNPQVDIILGQVTSGGTSCNGGGIAALDTLCAPGTLSFDNFGNLYVSDNYLEVSGNLRLLMFHNDLFPSNPGSIVYAPEATKQTNKTTFEVAFDSSNRMYTGYNPYTGLRFMQYYNNPTGYNSSDPTDQAYAVPTGTFNDFTGWVIGMTVDNNNNLFAFDANRGRVMRFDVPLSPDVTAPSVSITSPSEGATLGGITNITANASDSVAVYKVEFYADGDLVGTDYSSPYSASFDASAYTGAAVIEAIAYDGANSTNTSSINVTFSDDSTPPAVSITSPSNGASVSGDNVAVNTTATDNVGIDHVKLFVDNTEYATVSSFPYNFGWDTTGYADHSSHTLRAQAFDAAGNNTNSSNITVTVLDGTPPTTGITSPSDGATVTKGTAVTITATASDNNALNRVDFYVNGIRKCAAVSTYTCRWNVPRAGGTFEIFSRAIDRGGNITDSAHITVTAP